MIRKKPPKIYENVVVENAGSEGRCIARINGKVVFIDYAVPGDVVDIKVYTKKKGHEYASIINLKKPSDKRVDPFCNHFGLCGGCKWQQMDYNTQLQYKQQQVVDAFERIGKFKFPPIKPIIGSNKTTNYRNKLEYSFTAKKWLTEANYHSQNTQDSLKGLGYHVPQKFDKVFDVEQCFLMDDLNNKIRNFIKQFCIEHNYSFYNLNTHEGFMRNIILRNNSKGEWMLIVVFSEEREQQIINLMRAILDNFFQITSLFYIINNKLNDTIFDLDLVLFYGKPFITEVFDDIEYEIGPKSFFQTNTQQAYQLYKITKEFADITKDKIVYDLYTGVGSIALFVANYAKHVVGIEYIDQAIEDAKQNARLNGILNVSFFSGDLKDVLNDDFISSNGKPDILITDPPRAGMHKKVCEQILLVEPQKIVYVSCNPATQARDIAILSEKFSVDAVQPIDMFPHTHHVENIALLTLK